MRARAVRLTIPKPPPSFTANAAIARSASLSASGRRSPLRSASQRRIEPFGAARSASVRAWPLPRCGRRSTVAPAASARNAVASREPSSATITSVPGKLSWIAATVVAIVASSSRAATRTAAGSATRRSLDRRHDSVVGVRLQAVVADRAAAEQERERKAAGRRVYVVHRRQDGVTPGRDRGVTHVGGLDPDRRHVRVTEALVEPGQKRRGLAALGLDG